MLNNEIIQNIKVTTAMEGYTIKENDINLINNYLDNKITELEGIEAIKKDILLKMV